ncbi:hypothetical protein N7450_007534 [Penicillium hetheringtonii]|uniref:FAD-binding domain-containing protein n=1 Tax=Penicillium hetheringtonii TaxID=911720 RepID=A0AAD6GRN5_9EURO|nr:hypothetical protein N7450_007534 [Penicillium hetheringtonii]
MRIIVVGAGIAGLSLAITLSQAGYDVQVVESAPQLAELGAGIQMTPQAVKYFDQWGLKEDIRAHSSMLQQTFVRDHRNDDPIGVLDVADMENQYGAPYIVLHRATLHDILHKHAIRSGAKILLDSKVIEYDFDKGAIWLKNGRTIEADLVIAADGINSFARSRLLKDADPASQPTGWAAFRMMAEVSKIKEHPELTELGIGNSENSNFWIAPDVSCMTYQIKGATMLNTVLSHRDTVDTTTMSYDEHKEIVKELFKDFSPVVQKLLDISLPKIVNYPVYAVPPLQSWTHPSGHFTLAGDAAHAMAFYLSMGVSLAVEDAVSLAAALDLACPNRSDVPEPNQLKAALSVFENVRKKRTTAVQRASLRGGDSYHVPAGKEREALHNVIKNANEIIEVPIEDLHDAAEIEDEISAAVGGMMNRKTRDWCYGYDAIEDIKATWHSNN